MVRSTRKKPKKSSIHSIPELRRSFEYIEKYVDDKIKSGKTKEQIIRSLKKEWERVFFKELDRKSAEAFVNDRNSYRQCSQKRRTLRKSGGMAPIDYTTRPGIYVPPGQIPVNGQIPPLGGNFIDYISKGFWNPEPGQSYDPVPGQTRYNTSVPVGMGDNRITGGSRKLRRGGSFRFPASVPPSAIQEITSIAKGMPTGPSPHQVQR